MQSKENKNKWFRGLNPLRFVSPSVSYLNRNETGQWIISRIDKLLGKISYLSSISNIQKPKFFKILE